MNTIISSMIRWKWGWTTILCLYFALAIHPAILPAAGSDRTVVDSLGRVVALPDTVDRIACMYAFTGHVVGMLGKADKIVAVSNGLKRDVLLNDMYPAFRKAVVPKVQGAINMEELAGANPDIVFVHSQTGGNSAIADKFDAMGIAWIAVDFNSMAEQRRVVAIIGKAIGASAKADEYNRYYLDCIERVNRVMADLPPDKRLRVYHATVEPNRTAPKQSLSSDWIAATGLINVTSLDAGYLLTSEHMVGMEQILLWDPQVILANEPGVCDYIRNSPQWAPVTAVKTHRIHQLPIGISRWGHPGSLETPLAILWTTKTIYPESVSDMDLEGEIRRFYGRFFNYDLSDGMMDRILSGRGMRLKKGAGKK